MVIPLLANQDLTPILSKIRCTLMLKKVFFLQSKGVLVKFLRNSTLDPHCDAL